MKLLLLFFTFNIFFYHEINVFSNSKPNYSVKSLNSSRQFSDGYWNILAKPNSSQQIRLLITNHSNNTGHYKISLCNLTTNDNASINYGISNNKLTSKNNLQNCILDKSNVKNVSIKKHNNKIVTFDIKVPNKPYSGILMGGVNISSNDKETHFEGIHNEFSYSIAVIIKNSKIPTNPNLKLINSEIVHNSSNESPYIYSYMENNRNNFIKGLKIKTTIKNENGKKIDEHINNGSSVAPISKFRIINQLKKYISYGKYYVYIYAVDSSNHKWSFSKIISFGNNATNLTNGNNKSGKTLLFATSSLFIIILIFAFAFFIRNKK